MSRPSGSILRKLQLAFALSATLLAGLMAVFMDRALHRSLEAEDALVMEGQARAMLQRLASGEAGLETGSRPVLEKAEWRVLDREGRTLAQSAFMAGLPPLAPPSPEAPPREVEMAGGRVYSVLARPWLKPGGELGGTLFLAMDRSHEQALTTHFRRTLALAVGLAALVAALVARWVAAWGLAPLARIVREAGTIDDRHLDRRLEAAQFPGELRDLVDTLNAALARLQAAFERTDRLGAELAHELRTPLQNLRSTLENQALAPGSSEAHRAALGGLLEECDRMAALIDQILFLARADVESGRLAREAIDLPGLLEEVRGFFEASAEEAGVALRIAGAPGTLPGDRLLLTRALHNLVANALRHTPRGGTVTLGSGPAGAGAELWVEDTGSGIAPEWIPRLGQPFTRPPEPRPEGGLGLGLAIVARIAAMLGGTMDIRSRVGEGTRVTLRIPT
ncbi:MAG TPA: ATP-binding protein [Holophagaceae bacterium]